MTPTKTHLTFALRTAAVVLGLFGAAAHYHAAATPSPGQLAALSSQAQALEDTNAIKKLQRAYGFYLDRGYWGEAADLFADDATFEWGMDGVYVGKARIREYLVRQGGGNPGPGLPYGQFNQRMQLQPIVQVAADGRSAKARWRELSMTGRFQRSAEWGEGVYENTYIREGGVWKIKSVRYYPTFIAPYEGGWAGLKSTPSDWRTQVSREFPADRPATSSYALFPAVFVPPFDYKTQSRKTPSSSDPEATRVALLQSREDIESLQAAYGYYIDKGLWSKAVDLFADDATYEYGQRGVYVGKRRIKSALGLMGPERLQPGLLNTYLMLQPIIHIAPDNETARARWRSVAMLAKDGKGQWGEGTYENEYVNDNGVWKIKSLHFYPTLFADYTLGWAEAPIPMEGPSADVPPDRPPTQTYRSFPHAYIPPFHYEHPVTKAPPMAHPAPSDDPAIEQLRKRITRLEDVAAVERLQRAYGYYVDKLLWPQVADLFAPDATLEIGGRGVFVGKPSILAYLQGLGLTGPQMNFLMNHQQWQGIVDVAAEGHTAEGRWTAFIMAGDVPDAVWGIATYENRYVKQDGVWKLKALHAPFQMYSPLKEGWGKSAMPNTRPDSWAPAPDYPPTVVYNNYPSFYVEPYHYPNPVTGAPMPEPHPAAGGIAPMKPSLE